MRGTRTKKTLGATIKIKAKHYYNKTQVDS